MGQCALDSQAIGVDISCCSYSPLYQSVVLAGLIPFEASLLGVVGGSLLPVFLWVFSLCVSLA